MDNSRLPIIEGDIARVPLTQELEAIIDASDIDICSAHRWSAARDRCRVYAVCHNTHRTQLKLHRVILGVTDPAIKVDHINGDGLDNRRCNLRIASHGENMKNRRNDKRNTSGYKGVDWVKNDRVWRARIAVDGKRIGLGRFRTALEAALAYDDGARKYHGEFKRLNFPGLLP